MADDGPRGEAKEELVECGHCGVWGSGHQQCSACRSVFYCSPECQSKDWKAHKPTCRRAGDKDTDVGDDGGKAKARQRRKFKPLRLTKITQSLRRAAKRLMDEEAYGEAAGAAALTTASAEGRWDLCAALVEAGVDPDHPCPWSDMGCRPLHFAANIAQCPASVAQLLAVGASVDQVRPGDGRTPLHMAIVAYSHVTDDGHGNLLAVVNILLGGGADPNAKDKFGATALVLLGSFYGAAVATARAGEGKPPPSLDRMLAVCDLILAKGGDMYTRDTYDYSPVEQMVKAGGGHEAVAAFLKRGPSHDPSALLKLNLSGDSWDDGVARVLLQAGADPDEAFHCACMWQDDGAVRSLAAHGADPASVDEQGRSALLVAALSSIPESSFCTCCNKKKDDGKPPADCGAGPEGGASGDVSGQESGEEEVDYGGGEEVVGGGRKPHKLTHCRKAKPAGLCLALLLATGRCSEACVQDAVEYIQKRIKEPHQAGAALSQIHEVEERLARGGLFALPILKAQLRGKRRWCVHCLRVTPDQDLRPCSCHKVAFCGRSCFKAHRHAGFHVHCPKPATKAPPP